jgi:hypothetical protein
MCDNQVIKEMVQKFVNDEKMFTSVDIGNAIKKETLSMDVRNRDVRNWLRANIGRDPVLQDYVTESIDINNGSGAATLYKPHWKDAEDYKDRDQKAFGPSNLSTFKQTVVPSALSPVTTTPTSSTGASNFSISSMLGSGSQSGGVVKMVKQCRYKRRIQISGAITKALGWMPGQQIDRDKVKIHTGALKPGLRVWYDGRVSIPRNVVGFGKDPVKIILKDDVIYFDKA